ncbi:high-affinity branched-chain amino acid ABC transporter substrate-binding protein [Cardiobacteriaceae bacterium TAE3-ERU3]|nr:high-affinity branched-chain amino acid ABC transporter substrate-binding protein [Cardiobacteriaceae bacterium TAE3-ERU3]
MKKSLLALAISTMMPAAFAADTITIALAGPTTGPVTQYGTMQNTGAKMAIEQINANGGMNGQQIEYKIYDDACEPKQAVSVANQIVNDGIQYVIGHLCSSSTLPAAEIYDEEGIVMVTPAATAPELTEKGYTTIFRTIGTDAQSAPTSANYIVDVLKPKRIALLHDKQQYGQGLAEGVEKVLKEKGVEPVIMEGVSKGQTDFAALITKLKSENVDFVYWGGYHPELGLIIRQGNDQGFNPTYMGADGIDNPDLFAIAGEAANGILATVPKNFAEDPNNAELVEAFKAKGDDVSGPFVLPGYTAVQVIVDAANEVGSNDDSEAVADAIRAGTFNTPIGEISYQENGNLKDFQSVIYELNADGSRKLVTGE